MHSFYLFLWIFFIYSFLGWCLEVCFFALNTGKFVNRGFLNGPVCPIYGFGVVIVVLCLTPLMENTLLLFLGSVLLTSLLELGVGFALEKLFHQRWWDYTNEPFNLGGYICLRFSLAWGLACLLVMEIIHPSVLWLILHIPHTLGLVLLACFVSVMAVDLTATVRTIARINRSLGQIDELAGRIKALSNDLGENLADRVLDAAEKGADWKESLADRREDLMEDQRISAGSGAAPGPASGGAGTAAQIPERAAGPPHLRSTPPAAGFPPDALHRPQAGPGAAAPASEGASGEKRRVCVIFLCSICYFVIY